MQSNGSALQPAPPHQSADIHVCLPAPSSHVVVCTWRCLVHVIAMNSKVGSIHCMYIIITSSFAHFTHSATSPSFAYVSNPVLDSSLCRAAAPRLHQLLLPHCVRFSCCSPIGSTAPRLHLLPQLHLLQLLLPDCVHFNCYFNCVFVCVCV